MAAGSTLSCVAYQWDSSGCSMARICASSRSSRAPSASVSALLLSALKASSACCLLNDLFQDKMFKATTMSRAALATLMQSVYGEATDLL